jgi:hypothetical protein
MVGYEGRAWVAYFWFVGWDCLSLGVHVSLLGPNLELHVPFGFVRIGRRKDAGLGADGWQFRKNVNMGGSL